MPVLTTPQIALHLKSVPTWTKRGKSIYRTFLFESFLNSIDFVDRVARKAEMLNHHPDIDIRYDEVTLTLTTHHDGGLTEKDFILAGQCDEIFVHYFRKQPHVAQLKK